MSNIPTTHLRPEAPAERRGITRRTLADQRNAGTGRTYVGIGSSVRDPLADVPAHESARRGEAVNDRAA